MKNTLSLELPKMNVIYIGIENPFSISASAINSNKFILDIIKGEGKIINQNDKFSILPHVMGVMKIRVRGISNKGDTIDFGDKEFRVKTIPDPVQTIGGKKGGSMRKSILLAQGGVAVTLENFEFDLGFNVTEFTVSSTFGEFEKSATAKGSRFSSEMIALIGQVQCGSKLYIEDVKAVGPDGTVRNLPSIVFKIIPEMSLDEISVVFDSLKSSSQWDKYFNLAVTYKENNYNDSASSYQVANNIYLHTNDTIYLKTAKELIESVIKKNDIIHVKSIQWRYLELYALIRYKLGYLNYVKLLEQGVRMLKNMDMKNDSSVIEFKMIK